MKKTIVLILALLTCLSFTSCRKIEGLTEEKKPTTESTPKNPFHFLFN